jgi:hypothetical protein
LPRDRIRVWVGVRVIVSVTPMIKVNVRVMFRNRVIFSVMPGLCFGLRLGLGLEYGYC